MDYDQWRAFLAVVQTKNFTRAAELLHVTQSTITTRIKTLEQRLGKTLLQRNNRRVEITQAGKTIYPYAKRIVDLIQECELAAQMEASFHDRLVIGSVHSLWDYVLAPVALQFQKDNPHIALRLLTGHSVEIVQLLLDGRADAGVVYLPPQHPDISTVPLYQDTVALVAHPDLPLPDGEMTPERLTKIPLIHLDWGAPFSEWFAQEAGRDFMPGMQVDHAALQLNYILAGAGAGFMLTSICEKLIEAGALRRVPYRARVPLPVHLIYLICLKRKEQEESLTAWRHMLLDRYQ